MIKNEYRRAFIMLRATAQGFGGHVRLERRTLTGSMYFSVTAPDGAGVLGAALAGQQNGEYYAVPLGTLTRDRRGQLTLAWTFDPRNIAGRALEAYPWVAVATAGQNCALALTGNVAGSRTLEPAALGRAVCALFSSRAAADAPAAELPSREAFAPEPLGIDDLAEDGAQAGEAASPAESPETDAAKPAPRPKEVSPAADADDSDSDVKIYMGSKARIYTALRSKNAPTERAAAEAGEAAADAAGPHGEGSNGAPDGARAENAASDAAREKARAEYSAAQGQTAAAALGMDITQTWPGAAEPLRRLFATQAPLDISLGDGFVYVRAPMPNASGYDACVIGLRAENGAITAIRYALPGRYAPQPPAGMECYRYVGDGGEGYWVTEVEEL